MNTPTKIAGFAAGLAAIFGITLVAGNAVGPIDEPATHREAHQPGQPSGHGGHEEDNAQAPSDDDRIPGGLMVSQNGYTLELADPTARSGADVPVRFAVRGPDGEPVTRYERSHDKLLHLIAVRRDLTGFQHVHPQLSDDGVWRTDLDLTPGEWRLYADFKPQRGDALTLGTDLSVPGRYQPADLPEASRVAHVDGYTVTLDGKLRPGSDSRLTLSVSRDGRPVTDLQPYLGAYGHLVALRDSDLAYLHVHPDGVPGDGKTPPGPEVVFYASVPSQGSYRLFLDFQHQGTVRTAAFTVHTDGQPTSEPAGQHDAGHDGH